MSSNSLTHVITISIRNTKVKKRNLILQAAVAGLFCAVTLSANATGSASNAIGNSAQIATQAVTSSSVIGSGSITYTVSGSIPIGNYYVYVQLGNGATFAFPTGGNVLATALVGSTPASITVGTGTILAGNTSIVAFPVSVTAVLPANSTFTFKPVGVVATDGAITGAVAAAASGALQATMSLGASASYSSSLTAIVSDEASPATAPIATFVSGISAAALSSGSFGGTSAPSVAFTGGTAEKVQINVLNGATGITLTGNVNVTAVTSSESLDLGGFYFVDVSSDATVTTPPFGANATNTFNLATDYAASTIAATVTGPTGFFNVANQTGGSVFLATNNTCATALAGGAASVSTNGSTATFSVAAPAAAAVTAADATAGVGAAATSSIIGPLYVCAKAPGTNSVQWVSGQPSITATLSETGVGTISIAATPLYDLLSNGGSAYVREYIPASVSPAYTSYIRVINTGAVTANVNAAVVSDVTGKTGVQGVIATAVPAGGAVTLSSFQIEAAIVAAGGVAPAGTAGAASGFRPRLFVTAPTTIAVQSFISDAQGNFSEVSGGNVGNITGTTSATTTGNINPNNQ